MPVKKRSQATPKAEPTADEPVESRREDAPPAGDEPEAVTADTGSGDESAAGEATAPPAGVRRTRRTISRHVVDEEIQETIVEDLPAAYSPPLSGYPATVG
jgi:hypothetical protein